MAERKLTPEDEAHVTLLCERMILTLRSIENVEHFPEGEQMRAIIERAAKNGDLRALRLVARNVDEMTLALPSAEREAMEALLRERVGVDKELERAEQRGKVVAILQRGTVASEKERRRLEEYMEMLEITGGDEAEAAAVRRLLSAQ
jgi:hypothetical protein